MTSGWSITVYRGGRVENIGSMTFIPIVQDGASLHRESFTSDRLAISPYRDAAVRVISDNGFPCLYMLKAGDLPFQVYAIPADELVYVEAWDQS